MDPAARLAAADANVVAAFDLLREHVADPRGGRRTFGAVHAIPTGLPVPFFNPVFALDDDSRLEDVLAAVDWMRSRGIEPAVNVAVRLDDRLQPGVVAAGFQRDPDPTPVMTLDPIPAAPPAPDGVEIHVGGADLFEPWHTALDSGPVWRRAAGRAFLGDERIRASVAVLDGEPVAAAAAVRHGTTLGIYAVGTREHARRRGIGRAVTWAAIDTGRAAWGSDIVILQSSAMGFPVYRSMGFEQVGALVEYRAPDAAAEGAETG